MVAAAVATFLLAYATTYPQMLLAALIATSGLTVVHAAEPEKLYTCLLYTSRCV